MVRAMAEASCVSAGDRISAPTPASADLGSSNVPDLGGSAVEIADRPTCIIILGMAGSGKTTFVQV